MEQLFIVFLSLPVWQLAAIAFGFGVIIGSFLNVYIYRFHTGKSLGGSSHCLSCATPLRWFELFPLVSYMALRGRCRSCGCHIPSRYFVVELLTGLLFVAAVFSATSFLELLLLWFVVSVLVVITVYDVQHFIIPDELTVVLFGAVCALLALHVWDGYLWQRVGLDVVAALAGAAFFYFLWFVSKGQWMGFGDVKLAVPLGLLVGASSVFSFVVTAFWVGTAISLGIIAWQYIQIRGKPALQSPGQQLTIKSAVPFAPFLIAGSLVVYFTHFNVLSLFSF